MDEKIKVLLGEMECNERARQGKCRRLCDGCDLSRNHVAFHSVGNWLIEMMRCGASWLNEPINIEAYDTDEIYSDILHCTKCNAYWAMYEEAKDVKFCPKCGQRFEGVQWCEGYYYPEEH